MDTQKLSETFERAIDEIASNPRFSDVEIITHKLRRSTDSATLSVTIDRRGGVDIDTCERVAGWLNDRLDPTGLPYALEVESAGLNRALTKPGDYQRFTGQPVKVRTSLLVQGNKTHRGTLRGVRGTNVILETDRGELLLPLGTIASANLEYDIRADLKRDKEKRKSCLNK